MSEQNTKYIAIQADPIGSLKLGSDSTLFIAAELCSRGYQTFFYTADNLFLKDNQCFAQGIFAHVEHVNHQSSYTSQNEALLNLDTSYALLIRQDPPFDMGYITNTYILERLSSKVFVLNNPTAIRANSEKMIVFKFAEFMPPSMVIGSLNDQVIEFIKQHEQSVIKPLYWFGGRHLELIEAKYLEKAIETMVGSIKQHGHILVQKFLPKVYEGDKRIIMLDGEAVAAMKRIPKAGNFVANLAAGGSAAATDLTDKEREVLKPVGAYLKEQGLVFAGVDMIDEYLVEINVTSPTGLIPIAKLYGLNLAKNIVDYIEKATSC